MANDKADPAEEIAAADLAHDYNAENPSHGNGGGL